MIEHFNLMTFNSTHDAMAAEKYIQSMGIPGRIIPVPTEITADCGLALRFPVESRDAVLSYINNIHFAACYHVTKEGLKKTITPFSSFS